MKLIGTYFTGPNKYGDFNWMIERKEYSDCLFLFNDNVEHHHTCIKGGGNAIIRPYNNRGKSFGIPTGYITPGVKGYKGFKNLEECKDILDQCFNELIFLLSQNKYSTIFYSKESETSDKIGTAIFDVSDEVKDYILLKLKNKIFNFNK